MNITAKVLYKLIYFFIFLFLFTVITFIFFPYGKLKKPIELSIYDNTGLKTAIKSISPSIFFGLNLTGVKIYNSAAGSNSRRKKTIADIQSIRINNILAMGADYLLFKNLPVNLNSNGIKINSIKKGFINIPALNFKSLKIQLYIKNIKNASITSASGRLRFTGDISGSLNIKNAALTPIFKINSGVFRVKPVQSVYGKFSTLFTTMFKKGKDGYFVYDINNLIL